MNKLVPILAMIFFVAIASTNAVAEVGPKIVRGYVYDINGQALSNVTVVVSIGELSISDETDDCGLYSVCFGFDEWNVGDEITVIALDVLETVIADDGPIQYVDINTMYAIPEFGNDTGFVVMLVLLCFVVLVLPKCKKRSRS